MVNVDGWTKGRKDGNFHAQVFHAKAGATINNLMYNCRLELLKPYTHGGKWTQNPTSFNEVISHMSHVMRKHVFGGVQPGKTQTCSATETSLSLEILDLARTDYTIQAANNKGADQTAQMRRLICTFVVRIWHDRFSHGVAYINL